MGYTGTRPKFNTTKYNPRSSDPINPTEGEIQYADGTARSEGFWLYKNGTWEEVTSANNTQTLLNKQIAYTSTNDATTTGSNASLAAVTTGIVRLTNASLISVSGIPAGNSGQFLIIENKTGNQIIINNEETTPSAANRIQTGTNAGIPMPNTATFAFTYDSTSSRWQLTGGSGSGSGSGSGINYLSANPGAEADTTGWTTYVDSQTATMTIASPCVVTVTSTSSWYVGMPVVFTTTGALPTGVTAGTTYYVSNVLNSTDFRIAATIGGADINTSGSQSGVHTQRYCVPTGNVVGSSTTTWTRSTSSPLRGSASFLWTKTAAILAGEGVSYSFTIDNTDKAKVLQVSFDYKIASGTFADGDLTCYLYDVTNVAIIQPAGYSIVNASVSMKHTATFQTSSSSTSYKLLIHTSSGSASAFTVQFDNFSVGPQIIANGAVITDRAFKTMTLTNAGTAIVDATMFRSGNEAFFEGTITMGASLPTGTITLNMPSGMTIDTSLGTPLTLGIAGASNSGGTGSYTGQVRSNSASSVIFYGDSNAGVWNATVPRTFANLDRIDFSFSVPIVGWSSNTVMSNDTDTRIVAARFTTASSQSITNAGVIVDYNVKDYDTHGAVTTGASWKFTAPVPGKYEIKGYMQLVPGTNAVADRLRMSLFKNGSVFEDIGVSLAQTTSAITHRFSFSGTINLVAGDYIHVVADLPTTTNLAGSSQVNWISISRISGQATIAATESISARYANTAGTTINTGALTVVPFVTKVVDTHAAWDGTNKFTAPISGKYAIKANLILAGATLTTAQNFQCAVYKNGALDSYGLIIYGNGMAATYTVNASTTINLLAGEYVQLFAWCNGTSTALSTATGANYICIERVGN